MENDTPIQTSGSISYSEAEDVIEKIVSIKKNKFNFPGTDTEDLAQEIRLICLEALSNFDPSKLGKSVFHFVARCVDNRLYNKFRGVYLDNNPPCLRCEHYHRQTKTCKIDEVGCTRIVQYRDRMAKRRAIDAPLSYNSFLDAEETADYSQHDSLSQPSNTGICDLDEDLKSQLDEYLLPYYDQMVNGELDEVPDTYVRIIQTQVRAIIKERE